MLALPAVPQVAATTFTAGVAGVTSIAALLNDADATEVQLPFPAVTVYDVPTIIPVIAPPAPAVGPVGVNV